MNSPERFRRALAGEPVDRLPVIEWATWWDQTLDAWHAAGLDPALQDLHDYFGLDRQHQFWIPVRDEGCPQPAGFGAPILWDEADYERILPHLYTDRLLEGIQRECRRIHRERGDYAFWYSLDGFFWFPRTLFGIENHFFAFYDYPELMTRMNEDLCAYYKKVLAIVNEETEPVFMTFAEDMSYNHGPMCSYAQYAQFVLPYYQQLTPLVRAGGAHPFIDTDGNVEPLIPWFLEGGIEGILPLERMAGVDVCRIKEKYPQLLMLGGFDKTVMHKGEAAMRAEFARILPAVRAGGYIPAVDHQTPPDVTVENYRIFVRLLREVSYAPYGPCAPYDPCGPSGVPARSLG